MEEKKITECCGIINEECPTQEVQCKNCELNKWYLYYKELAKKIKNNEMEE